jgi:hypothetical protein
MKKIKKISKKCIKTLDKLSRKWYNKGTKEMEVQKMTVQEILRKGEIRVTKKWTVIICDYEQIPSYLCAKTILSNNLALWAGEKRAIPFNLLNKNYASIFKNKEEQIAVIRIVK